MIVIACALFSYHTALQGKGITCGFKVEHLAYWRPLERERKRPTLEASKRLACTRNPTNGVLLDCSFTAGMKSCSRKYINNINFKFKICSPWYILPGVYVYVDSRWKLLILMKYREEFVVVPCAWISCWIVLHCRVGAPLGLRLPETKAMHHRSLAIVSSASDITSSPSQALAENWRIQWNHALNKRTTRNHARYCQRLSWCYLISRVLCYIIYYCCCVKVPKPSSLGYLSCLFN